MNDCVIVGGGPAGLAASAALTELGVDHLILERGRVDDTWRHQRWDSFRLNTPGWMNAVLGEQPRDAYLTAPELVSRLERLAAKAPVLEQTHVTELRSNRDGFELRTTDGTIHARSVVVATGGENVGSRPPLASRLPARIAQYHAADYRAPGDLPAGTVLVVGSAQSGCQIAEDLQSSGRRVILATSPVGRVPTPYRGRDAIDWLAEAGFFEQRPADLPDPSLVHQRQPTVAPGGRELGLPQLTRSGVTLVGRLVEVTGEQARFDSAAANLVAGETFAGRVRALIDEVIKRRGVIVPAAGPEDVGAQVDLRPPPDQPALVDLRAHDVSTVVWCTGFTGDFSWLPRDLLDPDGNPRREEAAAPVPGLWYLGLRWLTRRSSGIMYGMPGDAATVAGAVKRWLSVRTRSRPRPDRPARKPRTPGLPSPGSDRDPPAHDLADQGG